MMKPQRGKTPRKPPRQNRARQSEPVEVYCRIRPKLSSTDDVCLEVLNSTTVKAVAPKGSAAARNGSIKETQCTFQHVFQENTGQEALFDHVGLPLVQDVLQGKNALLFAYGVTSSGKTHTMTGTPQNPGVLPRALDVLFNSIEHLQAKKYVFKPDKMNGFDVQGEVDAMQDRQRKEILPRVYNTRVPPSPRTPGKFDFSQVPRVKERTKIEGVEEDNNYAMFVSYIEIYNNNVYDLLEELPYDPITGYKAPTAKLLREDGKKNMYVNNCVEVEVKSPEEAYDTFLRGQKRRKVAQTALNAESSRSHSIFNIRVVQAPLDASGAEVLQDKNRVVSGQLALVDLAGSERIGRTGNLGDRLREASNINNSLMTLRLCMDQLRENQLNGTNRIVRYRDSSITHLFKNFFDGEGKVRMIVCVNPIAAEYDETIQVMKFAEITQEVQVDRQEQARFDIGLTPGRRRQYQQYKEAITKMEEEGVPREDIPPPFLFSMGPPFPKLELNDTEDDQTLFTLNQFLKNRIDRRAALITDLTSRQEKFRGHLIETERENTSLKRKVKELEDELSEKERECSRLSKKIKTYEKENTSLHKATHQYEEENRDLERQIKEQEMKLLQEQGVKDRLEQDHRYKLILQERELKSQLEAEKRKLRSQCQADLKANRKLAMVKSVLSSDSDVDSVTSSASSTLPKSRLLAKSTPDLSDSTVRPAARPTPARRPLHQRSITQVPGSARKPPPLKPKPAMHLRHRRSRSAQDVWLEHKPEPVPVADSLLQPNMRRRKSVTKITEKATTKANKYVLATHGIDSDGDFATKYVKGDIMATAGGGSAVVFTDVEKLKVTEPGVRHWKSKPLQPEDYDGEWTDTEERTRIAVECHGKPK